VLQLAARCYFRLARDWRLVVQGEVVLVAHQCLRVQGTPSGLQHGCQLVCGLSLIMMVFDKLGVVAVTLFLQLGLALMFTLRFVLLLGFILCDHVRLQSLKAGHFLRMGRFFLQSLLISHRES